MSKLKIGDVVHLNSGSVRMTVTGCRLVEAGTFVDVAWIHFETQQMHFATMHEDCFEKDKSYGSAERKGREGQSQKAPG